MTQLLCRTVWQFLQTLNMQLTYDPEIALLGIYPRKTKTYVHRKAYARTFIDALFKVAENWKQPRCPPPGEQLNKLLPPYQGP